MKLTQLSLFIPTGAIILSSGIATANCLPKYQEAINAAGSKNAQAFTTGAATGAVAATGLSVTQQILFDSTPLLPQAGGLISGVITTNAYSQNVGDLEEMVLLLKDIQLFNATEVKGVALSNFETAVAQVTSGATLAQIAEIASRADAEGTLCQDGFISLKGLVSLTKNAIEKK